MSSLLHRKDHDLPSLILCMSEQSALIPRDYHSSNRVPRLYGCVAAIEFPGGALPIESERDR